MNMPHPSAGVEGPADFATQLVTAPGLWQPEAGRGITVLLLDSRRCRVASQSAPTLDALRPPPDEVLAAASAVTAAAVRGPVPPPDEFSERIRAIAPGVAVSDLITADDGRWRSLNCAIPGCCGGLAGERLLSPVEQYCLHVAGVVMDGLLVSDVHTISDVMDSRGLRDMLLGYAFRSHRAGELVEMCQQRSSDPGASLSIGTVGALAAWAADAGRSHPESAPAQQWLETVASAAGQEGPWQRLAQLADRLMRIGDPARPPDYLAAVRNVSLADAAAFADPAEPLKAKVLREHVLALMNPQRPEPPEPPPHLRSHGGRGPHTPPRAPGNGPRR